MEWVDYSVFDDQLV